MELLKIEIIIPNTFLQELIEKLEELDVHGYTALEIFRGKGIKRGEHLAEGLLPTTRNSLVFTVGHKEKIENVIDQIQAYLNDRGGVLITYKIEYATGLS
jgi:nitrogen regulatory protein PII